jgi:hypothetical protein
MNVRLLGVVDLLVKVDDLGNLGWYPALLMCWQLREIFKNLKAEEPKHLLNEVKSV